MAFWCIALGLVLCLRPVPRPGWHGLIPLGLVLLLATLFALIVHDQMSSTPWLAPARPDRAWTDAAQALGTPLDPPGSLVRGQPLLSLGAPILAALSLAAGLAAGATAREARLLLKTLALSGSIYAALGIVLFAVSPTKVLWRDKLAYFGDLTATFTNRNTAAVYFAACALAGLMLAIRRLRHRLGSNASHPAAVLDLALSPAGAPVARYALPALLAMVAMLMTHSRAGVIIGLACIALAMFTALRSARPQALPARLAGAGALGLLSVGLLYGLGRGVTGRFDLEGAGSGGRLEGYHAIWQAIMDHPWRGNGLGSFAWNFPRYRPDSVSMWGVWDRAHSLPLEMAHDLGLPFTALALSLWLGMLVFLALRMTRPYRNETIMAAFFMALLASLHALVDFSLQIPGFFIPVLMLAGAGMAQAGLLAPPVQERRRTSR